MKRYKTVGILLFYALLGITYGEGFIVDPTTYRLGPGDKVEILVEGNIYFSYVTYVDPQGLIDIYITGLEGEIKVPKEMEEIAPTFSINKVAFIEVGGKTLREAQDLIEEKINTYYSNANVSLRLVKARTIRVPVTGAVVYPGIYRATPLERVSTLISRAGGLKPGASLSEIEIKGSKETKKVNLFEFLLKGKLEENPFIEEGVSIYVPQAEKTVRVKGAIIGQMERLESSSHSRASGGSSVTISFSPSNEVVCEYKEGDTVYDVIYKAGGTSALADMENIEIERNGKRIKKVSVNTPVIPEDVILVPILPNSVYVEGEVTNPGAYLYEPGKTVLDYIGEAGGFTERANRKEVYVIKRNGKREKVSLMDPVDRGEKIVVKRVLLKWWEDYLKIMSVVTTLVVTWLTLTR